MDEATVSKESERLIKESVIIDARDPTFLLNRFTYDEKPAYWQAVDQSGITAIAVDAGWVNDGLRDTALSVGEWYKRIRKNGHYVALTANDIEEAKANNKLAFVLSLQSPTAVESELGFVEVLYRMGIRMMQLAYQRRNFIAEGCGERSDGGLSKFGLEVLSEMNRVGMVVDLAHSSERTIWEVLERSTQPVVNSHAGVRALMDHPRNLSDDMLRALADGGGVFCVSAYSAFLKANGGQVGTDLNDYLRHVDHLLNLIGPDHIGIGFDVGENRNAAEAGLLHQFFGETGPPPKHRYISELTSRSRFPLLVEALVQAGYDDDVISKILGGNLMRVFRTVWGGEAQ